MQQSQCEGSTLRGRRCERHAVSQSLYCWQHQPQKECVICYKNVPALSAKWAHLPCHHEFCTRCIAKWWKRQDRMGLHRTCPICRRTSLVELPESDMPESQALGDTSSRRLNCVLLLLVVLSLPAAYFCQAEGVMLLYEARGNFRYL